MTTTRHMTAVALALVLGLGLTLFPKAAQASEEGKRNTALGLGAAAAYLLVTQKNKLPGLLAAGAAAYAYKQYDDSIRARHRREAAYNNYYDYRSRSYASDNTRYHRYVRDDEEYRYTNNRHDNGLHKGWYKGKHKGWYKHNK